MAKSSENPSATKAATGAERGPFPLDRILSQPDASKLKTPESFKQAFEKVIPHFLFPKPLQALLEYSDTIEIQVKKLHLAFQLFPEDYSRFLALVRASREKEEASLTEETTIRAYGTDQTRVFIFAVALSQTILKKPFQWEPRGARPKVDPKTILQHTVKIQAAYTGREVHLAFAAGLAYDMLCLIAKQVSSSPQTVVDHIGNLAQRGLETARIATAIARKSKDLRLSNYIYSICVLQNIGEAIHAVLDPEYAKFIAKVLKEDLPNTAKMHCEERAFGTTSEVMGNLVCQYFPVFRPVADVVMFRKQPYILKMAGKNDLYNLTAVCCLASYIETRPLKLIGLQDPRIAEKWLRPELGGIDITAAQIFAALESSR